MLTDVWPLFGLVLRTPRLELRLPSLEQLARLGRLADEGVHDPALMPFLAPWTDLPPGARARSVPVEIDGLEPCLELLGAVSPVAVPVSGA